MSSRNYDITGYGINLKDLEEHFNTEAIDEVLASSDDSDDDFDAHLTYLCCRHEVLSFTISENEDKYLYIAPALPWDFIERRKLTTEDIPAIIFSLLKPFLKDVTEQNIADLCDYIDDQYFG